jgi:hypothetical protein
MSVLQKWPEISVGGLVFGCVYCFQEQVHDNLDRPFRNEEVDW